MRSDLSWPPHRGQAGGFLGVWNQQWVSLDAELRRALPRWAWSHPGIENCLSAADPASALLAACENDAVAAALVGLAQAGDQLAGRLILQALLPRLSRLARRFGLEPCELVGSAWERVATHPIETRRNRVMDALAWDAVRAALRSPARAREHPGGITVASLIDRQAANETQPATDGQQILQAASQRGWLADSSVAVLTSVYLDGLSGREAARRHGISPELVRYRCSAGVRRLRQHAAELVTV